MQLVQMAKDSAEMEREGLSQGSEEWVVEKAGSRWMRWMGSVLPLWVWVVVERKIKVCSFVRRLVSVEERCLFLFWFVGAFRGAGLFSSELEAEG